MHTRTIGTSNLTVHAIGYGAMHLSIDPERRPSETEAITLLQRAVDELGLNFIDTADAYCANEREVGHNERLIAKALAGERRNRVVVATKGGSVRPEGRWERNGRPEHLRSAGERSLRALGVEQIDLYQLHAPDPNVPVEESLGAMAQMQREGKIAHLGVSNFTIEQLDRAWREAPFVSVQNQFSAINQRDQHEVLRWCEEHDVAYLPWNPVGGRGKAPTLGEASDPLEEVARAHSATPHQVAIAWLLQLSPAMLPIPGTTKFDHLASNMKAADLRLSDEEMGMLGRG